VAPAINHCGKKVNKIIIGNDSHVLTNSRKLLASQFKPPSNALAASAVIPPRPTFTVMFSLAGCKRSRQ